MKILILLLCFVPVRAFSVCAANTAGFYYAGQANSNDDCGGTNTNMVSVGALTYQNNTCGGYAKEVTGFALASKYDKDNSGLDSGFSTAQWSVEMYLYPTAFAFTDNVPLCWNTAGGLFRIDILNTGSFALQTNTGPFLGSGAGTVPLNTCTHIAATWDGTNRKVWVNGTVRNTDTNNGAGAAISANSMRVGYDLTLNSLTYTGIISGLRFSTLARTSFPTVDPPGSNPFWGPCRDYDRTRR